MGGGLYIVIIMITLVQVNETYIGVLKEIVAGLSDNGIYSYLDMHQVTYCLSTNPIIQPKYQSFEKNQILAL